MTVSCLEKRSMIVWVYTDVKNDEIQRAALQVRI